MKVIFLCDIFLYMLLPVYKLCHDRVCTQVFFNNNFSYSNTFYEYAEGNAQ